MCTCSQLSEKDTHLVIQREETPTHPVGLGLGHLDRGDDALAHVRDVQVRSLRAEARRLPVRVRVQVSQQGRGIVDLAVRDAVEAFRVASADAEGRKRPIVHDHIGSLDARVDAAEEVGHLRCDSGAGSSPIYDGLDFFCSSFFCSVSFLDGAERCNKVATTMCIYGTNHCIFDLHG